MDLGLGDRVALVLGASKGIGRAVAGVLAREGARVAIASRSRERIERAAQVLADEARTGGRLSAHVVDAADPDALTDLAHAVAAELGPIDVLVTNTGGPPAGDSLGFDRARWESAYRSLVLGPIALIEAVVPSMRERGWGRIVNITSRATHEPTPGLMLSNSHRLAAVGAFKTLATELASDGILLNSVAPGLIATDRISELRGGVPLEQLLAEPQPDIPVGRIGRVEEIADVVAFLCSERASYVTGVNLLVDGGAVRAL